MVKFVILFFIVFCIFFIFCLEGGNNNGDIELSVIFLSWLLWKFVLVILIVILFVFLFKNVVVVVFVLGFV